MKLQLNLFNLKVKKENENYSLIKTLQYFAFKNYLDFVQKEKCSKPFLHLLSTFSK